jgi:hypothetical protein
VGFPPYGSDGAPDDRVEYVDLGGRRERGRGRAWLSRLLVACLVIAAVVAAVGRSSHRHAPAPAPEPSPLPSPRPLPPVSVFSVGHRLLGVTAGWELFGLDQAEVVAIQLARGRIVRTPLPPLEGRGPVSLLIGQSAAIIRPMDNTSGYLVPAGDQARPLSGALASGDLLLPGPRPSQDWVVGDSSSMLSLVTAAGHLTRVHITLSASAWAVRSAMPDGRGGVLVSNVISGDQYDATPGTFRPVGAILAAVGPRSWLGISCHSSRCRNIVINPVTGSRRILPGPPVHLIAWPWPFEPGAVAPDGSAAAVAVAVGNDKVALELINLSSGAVITVPVPVDQDSSSQTLVWSPDSQWLFVLSAGGKLLAVNAHSHQVQSLGVPLPRFTQLAVSAAG